ncbi:MAG: Fe-S cluster assembly protein SufD [Bacteroidales bacterium]|nr:Fe-S cluster assembly protein SufD [Bacteroidales bacterium]
MEKKFLKLNDKFNKQTSLFNDLINLFEENKNQIFKNDTKKISEVRKQALEKFSKSELPTLKHEKWRDTDLSKTLSKNYKYYFDAEENNSEIGKTFKCVVPQLDSLSFTFVNGWNTFESELITLEDGIIIGSFSDAMKKFPEIVEQHFAKTFQPEKDFFSLLNTSYAQDGFFIYVPDNVNSQKSIQIVNIINNDENIFLQPRNLVIIGKNSKLSLIHCHDSVNQKNSFTNSVTEIFLNENSNIDYYKLQNLNNQSTLLNHTNFYQNTNSNISSNSISLNGGLIRNETCVEIEGEGCAANVYGLFLMDDKQHIDNHIFIDHKKSNCVSNELFKGILDDNASAVFNGHVLVRQDSQKTEAFQSNKNILLTDTAKINTKPFLEIYADDVKCSHGATVGQLDNEALFYLRSRGISENNARMLLMYAFAAEVINKISIEPLKNRIDDMVKKRLRGELSVCDQCVLHCGTPEKEIDFEIDLSKI